MEDGTVSGYQLETVRQGGRVDTAAVRTGGHSNQRVDVAIHCGDLTPSSSDGRPEENWRTAKDRCSW
jgi:hypothetical protein